MTTTFRPGLNGKRVLLPLWHELDLDEVMSFGPSVADKVAVRTAGLPIDEIARQTAEAYIQARRTSPDLGPRSSVYGHACHVRATSDGTRPVLTVNPGQSLVGRRAA